MRISDLEFRRVLFRSRLQDHGLLKIITRAGFGFVLQRVAADRDDVTVAERVLGDRFAVDLCAVGRIEIFEERVLENGDDGGVATGHGLVIERDVVVRMPADRSEEHTSELQALMRIAY